MVFEAANLEISNLIHSVYGDNVGYEIYRCEVQGWGRVVLRCGQMQVTHTYRKIALNARDLWRERSHVEKNFLEVAGKARIVDLANLMVILPDDDRDAEQVYELDDLEDEEVLEFGTWLIHAKFIVPVTMEVLSRWHQFST